MSTNNDKGNDKGGDKELDEVNVVVTGFAPGGVDELPWPVQPINAAWLLTNAMPRETVRKLVPDLWDAKTDTFRMYKDPDKSTTVKIDAMLHMGILDKPKLPWRLERYSFKSGYVFPDAGNKKPSEADRTGGGRWVGLPERLETDLNLDSIFEQVKSQLKNGEVVLAEDPNRFLCAYIYYASLAELQIRDESKRVLFMHIPIEHESADIKHGVNVACTVIKAMVQDLEASRSKGM